MCQLLCRIILCPLTANTWDSKFNEFKIRVIADHDLDLRGLRTQWTTEGQEGLCMYSTVRKSWATAHALCFDGKMGNWCNDLLKLVNMLE